MPANNEGFVGCLTYFLSETLMSKLPIVITFVNAVSSACGVAFMAESPQATATTSSLVS